MSLLLHLICRGQNRDSEISLNIHVQPITYMIFFFFGNSARVIQWKNDNIFILTYGISTSVWEKMDPSIHTMHKTDHEVNCITLWKIFSRLYIHFLVQLSNFSYRDEKLLSYENDSDIYSRTSLMLPLFPTQGTCV